MCVLVSVCVLVYVGVYVGVCVCRCVCVCVSDCVSLCIKHVFERQNRDATKVALQHGVKRTLAGLSATFPPQERETQGFCLIR